MTSRFLCPLQTMISGTRCLLTNSARSTCNCSSTFPEKVATRPLFVRPQPCTATAHTHYHVLTDLASVDPPAALAIVTPEPLLTTNWHLPHKASDTALASPDDHTRLESGCSPQQCPAYHNRTSFSDQLQTQTISFRVLWFESSSSPSSAHR